jgi:DEAD/DEAH box helicase domain-containing protein
VGVVVVDVETQDWGGEKPGRARAPRLAVAVVYEAASGTYRAYFEGHASALLERLHRAELVVGFAVRSFDYRVLERYGGPSVHELPTLDILEEVRRAVRRPVGLHHSALATLGRGKSADGWQALRWWRAGQVERVVEYCRRDVELTWELFAFGCRNGYIRYWDRQGQLRQVPVVWRCARR